MILSNMPSFNGPLASFGRHWGKSVLGGKKATSSVLADQRGDSLGNGTMSSRFHRSQMDAFLLLLRWKSWMNMPSSFPEKAGNSTKFVSFVYRVWEATRNFFNQGYCCTETPFGVGQAKRLPYGKSRKRQMLSLWGGLAFGLSIVLIQSPLPDRATMYLKAFYLPICLFQKINSRKHIKKQY